MATWRLRITLVVPASILLSPDNGPPEKLEFTSRVPDQARDYGSYRVSLQNAADDPGGVTHGHLPQAKLVHLLTDAEGDDAPEATQAFAPVLASILDLMSFEMGAVITIGASELVDITPPVAVGDERECSSFSMGPLDKNLRLVEMQAIRGALHGQLPDVRTITNSRVAAVLRWFVKALDTTLLHDQFIFLWIALEILSDDSKIKVEAPYKASCGHEIPSCPICERSTARPVFGPSRKAYLESFGVTSGDADTLWQLRQLMHGAINFDSAKLDKLPSTLQVLRAVVAAGLKERLGIDPRAAPLVSSSGLSVHPTIALGGTRVIDEKDIEIL